MKKKVKINSLADELYTHRSQLTSSYYMIEKLLGKNRTVSYLGNCLEDRDFIVLERCFKRIKQYKRRKNVSESN